MSGLGRIVEICQRLLRTKAGALSQLTTYPADTETRASALNGFTVQRADGLINLLTWCGKT